MAAAAMLLCAAAIRPSLLRVGARVLSTDIGRPWEVPATKLSPKNLTAEDKSFVLAEVARFGGAQPIEEAFMPPSSWYLTDAFAKAEAAAVFGPTWQLACRTDQVSTPGQFAATFVGAGEPVIVVRGKDNVLRALSNVCRHHAARIAEGNGDASQFVCPYHGWTYDLKVGLECVCVCACLFCVCAYLVFICLNSCRVN